MARKRKDEVDCEPGRKYFPWTDELDKVLVKCIISLVENKKIDAKGKFLLGAYKELERLMEEKKPGCGVKADPNIISRCKTLKKKFLAIQELRALSGSRWDDMNKMVIIEHQVYADYVEKHGHCAKLNRVAFPCYDSLAVVFGNVRAPGGGVVGLEELDQACPKIDVPKKLMLGWKNSDNGVHVDQTDTSDQQNDEHGRKNEAEKDNNLNDQTEFVVPDEEHNPPTPSEKGCQSEASSRPKRVRRSSNEFVNETCELKLMIKETINTLRSMLEESDTLHKQKNMLYEEIGKIEGLTEDQVMDAAISIVKDDNMTPRLKQKCSSSSSICRCSICKVLSNAGRNNPFLLQLQRSSRSSIATANRFPVWQPGALSRTMK
ncbi:hypothetical protein LINGRAHAP2_LOCUS13674 [Linum grandiflorum]